MIDVNPEIISRAFEIQWLSDTLEHYGEDEEYYALDLSKEKDARFAIRKWLARGWRNQERSIYKESLRYLITLKGKDLSGKYLDGNYNLSGIDDKPTIEEFDKAFNQFLLWLWDEWFHEPFTPAELSNYRTRTDFEFVNFPHVPEMCKMPKYE